MNKLIVLYDTTTGLILGHGSKDGSWSVVASGAGKLKDKGLKNFDLDSVQDADQVVLSTQNGRTYVGGKSGKFETPETEELDVSVEVRRWSSACSWSSAEREAAVAAKKSELGSDNVAAIVVVTEKAGVDVREWKVDLGTLRLVRRDDFQYE